MVELLAQSPLNGIVSIEIGDVVLREVDLGPLTSVAPFKGQDAALSEAFDAAHDVAWPAPKRARGKDGARAIWFGHRVVLLAGPEPDRGLAKHAALTDQTDAWACLRLEGVGAEDVLARLTPLELRPSVFKRGHTARTALQHMTASITRVAAHGFLILVFRSMADTLHHDLETAMRGVAARRRG